MLRVELTQEEQEHLRGYNKTSPLVVVRLKAQAVLMRDRQIKMTNIAHVVGRSERSVSLWLKDWEVKRMASLFTGHKNNENASKLTKEQKQEIKNVLSKPPSDHGIPAPFWDVPSLKTYVEATFSVVYESLQSYHLLLKFSNLSFKYPDTFDRRRDETRITERMKEIRKEIKPFLKDPDWEVFAADEVRIQLEALTRRAWLRKGKRTIVKVDRKREAQNYIGFLNQKNFDCHLYELDWQNQEELLKMFPDFLHEYPNKKICITWDNARFHKGKEIRKSLRKGKLLERVHLINLPPYAPDHNPIERVWNAAKGELANIQLKNLQLVKDTFGNYVRQRKFSYQM
jgi:transposase